MSKSKEGEFWDAVGEIRDSDDRFRPQAYRFLMVALSHTVEALPASRREDPATRHLSGRELLQGVVELAQEEFGPCAPMVFREWGVLVSEDVGAMVFQLVEIGMLSARPEDTVEDFRGFDLSRALVANPDASSAA